MQIRFEIAAYMRLFLQIRWNDGWQIFLTNGEIIRGSSGRLINVHLTHITSRPLHEIGVGNLSINIGRNLCKIQQILRSTEFVTNKILQLEYESKTHPTSPRLNLNLFLTWKKKNVIRKYLQKYWAGGHKTKILDSGKIYTRYL